MSTVLFVALVTAAHPSGYRGTFPDLPNCVAEGRDLGDLMVHARTAATAELEAIANAGEAWPTPTPIEAIVAPAGHLAIPIDIAIDDPPMRVNISLGERLLQRLDAAAEQRGMTRSGFIAQSVRVSLGERPAADFEAASRRLQDDLNAWGRKLNDSLGPDSAFSRRMADLDDKVYDGVRRAADSVSAAMARRRDAARPPEPAHKDDPASPS